MFIHWQQLVFNRRAFLSRRGSRIIFIVADDTWPRAAAARFHEKPLFTVSNHSIVPGQMTENYPRKEVFFVREVRTRRRYKQPATGYHRRITDDREFYDTFCLRL